MNPDRNHAYVLPDDSVYIVNHAGSRVIRLSSSSGNQLFDEVSDGLEIVTLNKVKFLRVKVGDGLKINTDGKIILDPAKKYVLPAATAATLGGVKIGEYLTIEKDGKVSLNYQDLKKKLQPKWNAKKDEDGHIENKPFEKISDDFEVIDDELKLKDEFKTTNWSDVENKPFEKIGKGLDTTDDGTLQVIVNAEDLGVQRKLEAGQGIVINEEDNENPVISVSEDYSTKADLKKHVDDKENPHGVTAHQVGSLTKEESYANVIDQVIGKEKVQTKISIDFLDKITGSDVENPNWSGALLGSNSLPTPNLFKSEVVQERYNSLMYLDQKIVWASGGAANQSPCLLVKWNIIEILKRQLTESFFIDRGAITLQQQIETARMIFTVINPSVWGYGVSATGNKLNYRVWVNNNSWGGTRSNNTSTIAKMEYTSTGNATNNYISDDGFLYALVYSEPSDGTSSSTIYVDYARLDLTLELSARDHIEYMIAANHVENLATQEEAELGENNTKTMTPLRVIQAIAKWISGKYISVTGDETVIGIKNFMNGLKSKGKNVLIQEGEKIFDHTSQTDSAIKSGIIRFKRYGDWVLVNFNFQCGETNIASGGDLISSLELDIIPSGAVQVDVTFDKALTIETSGKVTALWGLDANKYYVGSATYFAKNKL